jgi:hypothetical protein
MQFFFNIFDSGLVESADSELRYRKLVCMGKSVCFGMGQGGVIIFKNIAPQSLELI